MSKELSKAISEYEVLYMSKAGDRVKTDSEEVLSIALRRMEDSYFKEELDALLRHTQSVMTEGDIKMSCIIYESLKVMCFFDSENLGNHEIDAICSNMRKRIKSLEQKKKLLGLKKGDTRFIEQMVSDFEAEIERLESIRPKKELVLIQDEKIKEQVEKKPKVKKEKVVKPEEKPKVQPNLSKSVKIVECIAIKDLERACIVKTKDKVYLGKNENVNGFSYDNKDDSLFEIKSHGEDIVFYMTTDLLDGYDLAEFLKEDKAGIRAYYNFMKKVFTTRLNDYGSVSEYTAFQEYYNKLISRLLEIESRNHSKDYCYLVLAKKIYELFEYYGFSYYQSSENVFELIVLGDIGTLTERLVELKRTCFVDSRSADAVEYILRELNPKWQESKPSSGKSYVLELLDDRNELVDRAIFSNLINATNEYQNRNSNHKRLLLRQKDVDIELIET